MKFNGAIPPWTFAVFIVIFIVSVYWVLHGVYGLGGWEATAGGMAGIFVLICFYTTVLMSARYILEEDFMHIKSLSAGRKTDKKVYYKDILEMTTFEYGKSERIRILYWAGKKAEQIDILSPAPKKQGVFFNKLIEEIQKYDNSHVISPEYIDKEVNIVMIELEKCAFMDKCRLNADQIIALVQDQGRIVLLGWCVLDKQEEIISTTPPEIKTKTYVYCDFPFVMHLDYATVEEVLKDTIWHVILKKDVRKIDVIAYGLYCEAVGDFE